MVYSYAKKTRRTYVCSISYDQIFGSDTQMENIFTFVSALFATFQ
jgi:hypothetical protein